MSETVLAVRYVGKFGGQVAERPAVPFMGAAWYAANGYLGYAGTLPLSRLDIVDGAVVELPETAAEAEPRVLSKLKLCEKLTESGLWETVRPVIEAEAGEYWTLAHDVSENHPCFAALRERLSPLLEAAGADLDALLDECIMERY